jgi:hypothetical protein
MQERHGQGNNTNNGKSVLQYFPKIKLSYETFVHKKVDDADDADVVVIIPQGIKCFIWFNRGQCHLIEHNKENNEMTIIRSISFPMNSGNAVFYGTLFQDKFVAIHDVLFYKGKPIYTQDRTFSNIMNLLKDVCLQNFSEGNMKSNAKDKTLFFGIPLMVDKKHDDATSFPVPPYLVESYQYRYYNKTLIYKLRMLNSQTEKSYEQVRCNKPSSTQIPTPIQQQQQIQQHQQQIQQQIQQHQQQPQKEKENKVKPKIVTEKNRIFKVVPDIQNDIYHLYEVNKDTKEERLFDVAYIPDYKTSVMMNYLFRNIKENTNLDALEESDSEEEFENDKFDKFVHLDRHKNMTCQYNYKFKKWTPVKLA